MSQRHRNSEFQLPPKQELRAHAHGERADDLLNEWARNSTNDVAPPT